MDGMTVVDMDGMSLILNSIFIIDLMTRSYNTNSATKKIGCEILNNISPSTLTHVLASYPCSDSHECAECATTLKHYLADAV